MPERECRASAKRQERGCNKTPISWRFALCNKHNDPVAAHTLVPGVSLYDFSQASDAESQAVGDEESMIFDS